jgi:hypothetical protein
MFGSNGPRVETLLRIGLPNLISMDWPTKSAQRFFWALAILMRGRRDPNDRDLDTEGIVGTATDLSAILAFHYKDMRILNRSEFMRIPENTKEINFTIGADCFKAFQELHRKVRPLINDII